MELKKVSKELAIKLKELGFCIPTIWYYHPNYGLSANSFCESEEMENMNSGKWAKGYYSAPELELAQKWFRERYNAFAIVELDQTHDPKYNVVISIWEYKEKGEWYSERYPDLTKSHEESLEIGLERLCKLIKENEI